LKRGPSALAHAFFSSQQPHFFLASRHAQSSPIVFRCAKENDVTRKARVAQLQHRIERIFIRISIALLIFVFLCIFIVVRWPLTWR
jgi:hypothetical protein